MSKAVKAIVDPIARRVMGMISRAVLKAVTDGGKRQFIQVVILKGETKDDVERVQQYGFTSHPLGGAQVIVACVGGNRDHPLAISVDDHRYRLTDLEPGEVAIFNHEGTKIVLKNDGVIEMTAATKVRIDAPLLECTGEIKDRCDSGGLDMHTMRSIYDEHTHPPSGAAANPQMGG